MIIKITTTKRKFSPFMQLKKQIRTKKKKKMKKKRIRKKDDKNGK